ncbi:3' terminal RNA ribose 2'-O-methyltransferase Hen1 [Arsenicicoccus dermatophilus]|uniref:3' terminal RNA ribose 2'-O-methyltransferase Hen1 n=1 Tax=Arsenicicoccus dermatophilus TaxID=1076331 RepID=UPI0030C734DC
MLLMLTSTATSATDLGFLLHKHPDRVQSTTLSVGRATVYYPEATPERCTVALQVDVDPIALVRRRGIKAPPGTLGQYINDRPYVAGSMMSTAIAQVFKTAMNGRCDACPDLVGQALPLTVRVPAMPCGGSRERSGPTLVRALFEPLGWRVEATTTPLAGDDAALDWGDAPAADVTLTGDHRLADALTHLYVLLPVLDGSKHYWTTSDEVDKLLRRGERWLPGHPERELITRRYLGLRGLVDDATARLTELDGSRDDADAPEAPPVAAPLKEIRRTTVLDLLRRLGARTVADVGCGEGFYLRSLLADPTFARVIGVDVSARELDRAERRLHLDRMPDSVRERLTLRQSSVTYVDDALAGLDAILLVEVIEHVDPERHPSLEAAVLGQARPRHVIVTTPNREHNAVYGLGEGELRHPDHRF